MKALLLTFFALTLTAQVTRAESVDWTLDKAHSKVGFTVRHLGLTKVHGQFDDFDATASADAKTGKITAVQASARAASINTGIAKRDEHLRSDDFFATDANPDIKATSRKITWKGNKVTAEVELTMRGITKTVIFKGEQLGLQKVNFGDGEQLRAGYSLAATINRKDFGLKFSGVTEGVAMVGDDVDITLDVELWRRP
ncbi:MAG: YceI family protein [Myxococcota bacterium]